MSRIVHLSGTAAERRATTEALAQGLHFLGSINSTRFLTKDKRYAALSESDVMMVYGKQRVFDRLRDEPRDELSSDSYWSADYIVLLDTPDTALFNLASKVPTYPAEASMAHGCFAVISIVLGFAVTLGVSLLAGQREWSVVWAALMASAIILAFVFEYRAKAVYAGILGWWYVRNAIRSGSGTREHYIDIVTHLSQCDHPVVADVNKRILRFL